MERKKKTFNGDNCYMKTQIIKGDTIAQRIENRTRGKEIWFPILSLLIYYQVIYLPFLGIDFPVKW